MPRCRLIILIRKYCIVFFGVLLIFIWLNHNNKSDENDNEFEHFPVVSVENTLDWTPPEYYSRLKYLRELIQKGKISYQDDKIEDLSEIQYDPRARERKMNDFITENTSSAAKPARYFVNSKKCKMPYADPFSRDAMEIYNPSKLKVCTVEPDLFQLTFNQNTKHYQLQVNQTNALKLKVRMRCNYREVAQSNGNDPDIYSVLHPPVHFTDKCTLPQNVSGIVVECRDASNASRIAQQDAFSLVQVNNKSTRIETHPLDRQPSVIILGLDSMSRMNFRRTMPKTAEFVRKHGWYELEGYNKMGDSTVYNILPILSGHIMDEVHHFRGAATEDLLDNIPWIWKDYKNAGYDTSIAEDGLFSLFVSDSHRFDQKPTDHYLRPLLVAINRAMSKYRRFGFNYCMGRRLSISYVFDFCSQFTSRYVEELDRPVFGLFWSCTFTHDFYFAASSLDEKFLDFLHSLEQKKLFEKAIVILMSDHGARFGELLELSDSFLEERLPMLHIHLPPWFLETYPKFGEALFLNRNRLCSNFDLHNTLRHVLRLNATMRAELPPLPICPSSQSLLHPLPEERSCEDACISEHWCSCNEFVKQKLNGDIYLLGKLVIYYINRWMLQNRYNQLCQRILLKDMEYAAKKVLLEENGKETMYGSIVTYRLRFRTFPRDGKFQTTIRYNRELRSIENLYVPDISRLDTYKNHSNCVENNVAKKFCFCYPKANLSPFMTNWKNLQLTTLAEI